MTVELTKHQLKSATYEFIDNSSPYEVEQFIKSILREYCQDQSAPVGDIALLLVKKLTKNIQTETDIENIQKIKKIINKTTP